MSALPQSAPTVIELLADPPVPTDRDGQVALLRAACDEGLRVAIMCPVGRVVADARPGVSDRDRILPSGRLASKGMVPPELATADADTALGWLREYVWASQINDPGIAIEVGADAAAELLPGVGLMPGPGGAWVTAWISPTDAARAAEERERIEVERVRLAAERWEREKVDLPLYNGARKPNRSVRVHPDDLGDYEAGGDHGLAGGFFKVRMSKGGPPSYFLVLVALWGSGKLYAQRLNPDRYAGKVTKPGGDRYTVGECWDYSQAQSHTTWMRLIEQFGELMDAEAFKEFGQLYKVCIRCGQLLNNPMSVERSYGPVCAVHLGREHPLAHGAVDLTGGENLV